MQLLMSERLGLGDMRFWLAENPDATQFVVYRFSNGEFSCNGFTHLGECSSICQHVQFMKVHYEQRMRLKAERNLSDEQIWVVPEWYFETPKENVVIDFFAKRRIRL